MSFFVRSMHGCLHYLAQPMKQVLMEKCSIVVKHVCFVKQNNFRCRLNHAFLAVDRVSCVTTRNTSLCPKVNNILGKNKKIRILLSRLDFTTADPRYPSLEMLPMPLFVTYTYLKKDVKKERKKE